MRLFLSLAFSHGPHALCRFDRPLLPPLVKAGSPAHGGEGGARARARRLTPSESHVSRLLMASSILSPSFLLLLVSCSQPLPHVPSTLTLPPLSRVCPYVELWRSGGGAGEREAQRLCQPLQRGAHEHRSRERAGLTLAVAAEGEKGEECAGLEKARRERKGLAAGEGAKWEEKAFKEESEGRAFAGK